MNRLLSSTSLSRPLNILILDLETTVERIFGRIDNSPKNPKNRCVSAHYGWLGETTVDFVKNDIFFHNECNNPDGRDCLEEHLAYADVLVCHNAKFDVEWLLEMGFKLPPSVYCTMIGEYILAKGRRNGIGLKDTALRRKTDSFKKSDLVDENFKSGIGFEAMPLDEVIEYAEADVRACGEIYLAQQVDFEREHNQSLSTVVPFMNEMLMFLVEIEMNGTKIDLDVLSEVKKKFEAEKEGLTVRLNQIVEQVMGDTPINLNSGADMTKVVYSRVVLDRHIHQNTFNIGTNEAGKSLMPPRMSANQFSDAVRACTRIVEKTTAICCPDCQGAGSIQKYKVKTKVKNKKKYRVQGEPYKNRTRCATCKGLGALYQPTGQTAGLKMVPSGPMDASINGFKTDKVTLHKLIKQAKAKNNDVAVEFLTKSSRLNAISTYLDSFVAGIERGTRASGFLHPNFNQCIAATGRLSSGGGMSPNLQNQPKRGFPVRACIVSRFENGEILEIDYSQLEFRAAIELSRDSQGLADILEGKDIHKQTASIILQKDPSEVTKEERQTYGKPNTFLPLFGGTGNGMLPHEKAYFVRFGEIYEGVAAWHQRLMTGTLKDGIVQTPSGRQYFWPNVIRTRNNRVTNSTQILNYPVQGFSADLVQLSCIRALRLFREHKLKSKLILTVHDSIVSDTHPDEIDIVKQLLTEATTKVGEESEKLFGYKLVVPLDVEISHGKNWLDQEEYA
jgi:DNA polymerase I-like protein with 3'-5' exonuclease and polymerase domains